MSQSFIHIILAASDLSPIKGLANPVENAPKSLFTDAGLMIAIGLGLAIPLLLWARFFRKPSSEKRETHHWLVEDEEDDGSGKHKRRRRKKKRDHRPRNPTLAETGPAT